VLYGHCDEGLAVPYQPFIEALRPHLETIGLNGLRAELGHLAPELTRLFPELAGLGEPVRTDRASERFGLFEAVTALLEVVTSQQPALLILDDLHWAARPTLLLLRHLIRCDRQLRVLVLSVYRETDVDAGQPLAQLLADLQRDSSVEWLSIRGLDEIAIAALLEAAIGPQLDEDGSKLVRMLVDQTAGNPFFLRELLADLVESGERLRPGVTVVKLAVPDELRNVITQRVARLAAPCQNRLESLVWARRVSNHRPLACETPARHPTETHGSP
jgi:predicted ATPase